MSNKQLIINVCNLETRVALVENGDLVELFIEHQKDKTLVGNIYKAKVLRVIPGIQSAFIDIGENKPAFIYTDDVHSCEIFSANNSKEHAVYDEEVFNTIKQEQADTPIEKKLKQGQEIIVQIIKDQIGEKGARASMFLSLAGRYLVLMPNFTHIGVSRRIEDENEKLRLTNIIRSIKKDNIGVIVRTAAAYVKNKNHLEKDLAYLMRIYKNVIQEATKASAPKLLYQEPELPIKITRELYDNDITQIIIDNKKVYEKLKKFLQATIPGASKKLKLYTDPNPIFDTYELEIDIARALNKKVWLPSGGYLVIDQTEALTSFDVNTGKFVGKFSLQDTILKTNLEAVKEIALQLRLRNIGGIIIIDFIDMEKESDKQLVFNALEQELKKDKAKINILKINELGLVQMTRKRTSESLEHKLLTICPYCEGRAYIKSPQTVAYELFRDIQRHYCRTSKRDIHVVIDHRLQKWIEQNDPLLFMDLTKKFGIHVTLEPKFIDDRKSEQTVMYEID